MAIEDTCTRCGREFRDGVCPLGHPQRAVRSRRRRRLGRRVALVLVLIALGVGGYGGLVWYPARAAADLMVPASADFARAAGRFEDTVGLFPDAGTTEGDGAGAILESADAARRSLADARGRLEEQTVTSIPIVSSRPPLALAKEIRDRMLGFHTAALELVADLEAAARYLTELAPLLPQLENLDTALDDPQTPPEVRQTVAASRPIVDQIRADLRTLVPPDELGPLHASLFSIVRQIRSDLKEIERLADAGGSPVLTALIGDIRSQADAFRDGVAGAPKDARDAGIGERLRTVDTETGVIARDLRRLREDHGIDGITVPEV